MIHTVNEFLVLVQAIIDDMEFTIGRLCRAVPVGKVVYDDLNDPFLASRTLGIQGIIDQWLEIGNLLHPNDKRVSSESL